MATLQKFIRQKPNFNSVKSALQDDLKLLVREKDDKYIV